MDQRSACLYGKAGLSTGDICCPAMFPVLALVVEHVEPMGPEGLRGCSHNNAGALHLLAQDQLHTRCVLDGWSCHSLWSSLVYRCHYNLNQVILNNIEAKVRVR